MLTILPEALRAFSDYRMLAYSVVLVVFMIFRPQGIFGSWEFSLPKLINRIVYRNGRGGAAKAAIAAEGAATAAATEVETAEPAGKEA